jgi:hypothetical protein
MLSQTGAPEGGGELDHLHRERGEAVERVGVSLRRERAGEGDEEDAGNKERKQERSRHGAFSSGLAGAETGKADPWIRSAVQVFSGGSPGRILFPKIF